MVPDFPTNTQPTSRFALGAPLIDAVSNAHGAPETQQEFRFGASPSKHRLPPTRAARPTRSSGIFLELAVMAKLLMALAALGLLAATIPGVGRILTVVNPGPALVAATAVPPTFVLPKNLRRRVVDDKMPTTMSGVSMY
jgi:hypothetical protein